MEDKLPSDRVSMLRINWANPTLAVAWVMPSNRFFAITLSSSEGNISSIFLSMSFGISISLGFSVYITCNEISGILFSDSIDDRNKLQQIVNDIVRIG